MADFREVRAAEDVTDEILEMAEDIADLWFYQSVEIGWIAFWNRMDGKILQDGTVLDLGTDAQSPACLHIREHVLAYRRV